MPQYQAYGLQLRSSVPLPGFMPGSGDPDVEITLHSSPEIPAGTYLEFGSTSAVLSITGIGIFRLDRGRKVSARPAPGVEPERLRPFLSGTMLALLLRQRGYFVLHASCVAFGAEAVAFLGINGAGKSSLAAALSLRGHGILADDLTVLDLASAVPLALPGFPQLKLMSAVSTTLGLSHESLKSLPADDKLGYCVGSLFECRPLVLRKMLLLGAEPDLVSPELPLREAVIELVRHSYPSRLNHPAGPEHLRQCAALAKAVSIHRLRRFRELSELPELAAALDVHLAPGS